MTQGRPAAFSAGGLIHLVIRGRLASVLCLLALTGCGETGPKAVENDPFLGPGGGKPVAAAGAPAAGALPTNPAAPASQTAEVRDLPAPSARPSTADLAAGNDPALAAPRLEIGTSPTTPRPADSAIVRTTVPATNNPTVSITPPRTDPSPWHAPGATLQDPFTATPAQTIPVSGSAGRTQIITEQQGLDALKGRGATIYGPVQMANGDYRMLCLVPDKQNPTQVYRYEATASGDPVNAVRAMIAKIENDGR